jgi:hypothetical protein
MRAFGLDVALKEKKKKKKNKKQYCTDFSL